MDIFEFIGDVPPLLIFDNATWVGRGRNGDSLHESELPRPPALSGAFLQPVAFPLQKTAEFHYKKQIPISKLF